ncbi:MAG: recombinase family protein [Acidobacteriota bacterium]|nr:recombinase family protein [Acidobacteriota bacterium]
MKAKAGKGVGRKRVGIWIRVSTEDQARGDSPEHHERRARYYAEAKEWHVVEVYRLEAVSGKAIIALPEAARMLEDVRSGRITGLIFSKLARLARNTKELLEIADIFRSCDADLISLQESIDTSTPAGRLFYTMIAAMAQWEREEIAERVAASVPVRARLGKPLGGQAPFGYQWQDKQLVPHPQESPVRKLMYELFVTHRRKKTVARLLNEAGHRTRNGSRFTDTTVDRLLRDPSAKGKRRANYTKSMGDKKHWVLKPEDEWVFSEVEAIVSDELWEQCNLILSERRAGALRPAKKAVQLFAGVTYCVCGKKMYVPSNTAKYVCFSCRNKLPVVDLEGIFHEQLKGFFFSEADVMRYAQEADRVIREKQELLTSLEGKLKKLRQRMDKVLRLYLDGNISGEGFGLEYKPMESQVKQLDDHIPQLQSEIDFLRIQHLTSDQMLTQARDIYSRWPELERDEKRRIVENTVEKIVIGQGDVTIELGYLPSSSELAAKRQRNFIPALPFCHLALLAKKPRNGLYPATLSTYGDRLRARRLDLGLTQKQAAEKLGVDETSVFNWESNRVEPAVRLIPRIIRHGSLLLQMRLYISDCLGQLPQVV